MSNTRPAFKTQAAYVEWVDSMHAPGWQSEDAATGNIACVTVGHVVKRTPYSIVMALSRASQMHGHYIEIPLCSVKKFKKLRV